MNPDVSVVMSVYNGGEYLRSAIDSLLGQRNIDVEFVFVDDGSTDNSRKLLQQVAAEDHRVRVLCQKNVGLTQSLIRGCQEARGEFIARQDADDLSHPDRLRDQLQLLKSDSQLAFASSWIRTIGPANEVLFESETEVEPTLATKALRKREACPCHGSVMFRTSSYRKAGGYHSQFRYAQDFDLWMRISETGLLAVVPASLYSLRVLSDSISAQKKKVQEKLASIAIECSKARERGQSEESLLEEAERISNSLASESAGVCDTNYFIGNCLVKRRDRRARRYLLKSIAENPFKMKSWAMLAASYLQPAFDRRS